MIGFANTASAQNVRVQVGRDGFGISVGSHRGNGHWNGGYRHGGRRNDGHWGGDYRRYPRNQVLQLPELPEQPVLLRGPVTTTTRPRPSGSPCWSIARSAPATAGKISRFGCASWRTGTATSAPTCTATTTVASTSSTEPANSPGPRFG